MRVWEWRSWEFDMVDGVRGALEANRAAYDALRANLRYFLEAVMPVCRSTS